VLDDAFLPVVIGVSVLALIGAVVALAMSGGSYDRIGRGGMSIGDDRPAQLRALTAPAADPELAAEVRQLVEARNARRIARGEAPLDVEAEVAKRLRNE
jgi:hypothetical protein